MSTAQEIMMRQIEDQTKELNELRRRAGPALPTLESIRPRQQVSYEELGLLKNAQVAGKYNKFPGLREVVCLDAANRPITYYFGDPNACWNQHNLGHKNVRRLNTPSP